MVKLCLPWKKPGKTPGFHHLPFPRGWFTTVLPTLLLYGLELSTILKYTEMKWFKTFFFRMSSIIISTVMVISWWLNGFWNVAWNFPQFWNPSRNHPFTKKGHFSIHLSMLDNIPFGGWSCWSSPSGHQLISVDLLRWGYNPTLRLRIQVTAFPEPPPRMTILVRGVLRIEIFWHVNLSMILSILVIYEFFILFQLHGIKCLGPIASYIIYPARSCWRFASCRCKWQIWSVLLSAAGRKAVLQARKGRSVTLYLDSMSGPCTWTTAIFIELYSK